MKGAQAFEKALMEMACRLGGEKSTKALASVWPTLSVDPPGFSPEDLKKLSQISNSSRRSAWTASRVLVRSLKQSWGPSRRPNTEIKTTLTHSQVQRGVAGWVLGLGWQSELGDLACWGVDLEPDSRVLSSRLQARLISVNERALGLTGIEHWVIKEACFKACADNSGLVMTQFHIFSARDIDLPPYGKAWIGEVRAPESRLFRFALLHVPSWLFSEKLGPSEAESPGWCLGLARSL